MNFVPIFETSDKVKFDKVIELLESRNIKYQKLHEYRLFSENDFGEMDRKAIIRVGKSDFMLVNRILVSNRFKKYKDQQITEFKFLERSYFYLDKIPYVKKLYTPIKFILLFFLVLGIPFLLSVLFL